MKLLKYTSPLKIEILGSKKEKLHCLPTFAILKISESSCFTDAAFKEKTKECRLVFQMGWVFTAVLIFVS